MESRKRAASDGGGPTAKRQKGGGRSRGNRNHWNKQSKKGKKMMARGDWGILVTCDNRRVAKSVREMYSVLGDAVETIHANDAHFEAAPGDVTGGDSGDGSDDDDQGAADVPLDVQIAREIEESKPKFVERALRSVDTGVGGTYFLRFNRPFRPRGWVPGDGGGDDGATSVLCESVRGGASAATAAAEDDNNDDGVRRVGPRILRHPADVVRHILTAASEGSVGVRFTSKIYPVEATCFPDATHIETTAERVVGAFVASLSPAQREAGLTFTTEIKRRNNKNTPREDIQKAVFRSINPPHSIQFKDPDAIIVVDILGSVCCIGVATEWKRFSKYNLGVVGNKAADAKRSRSDSKGAGRGTTTTAAVTATAEVATATAEPAAAAVAEAAPVAAAPNVATPSLATPETSST